MPNLTFAQSFAAIQQLAADYSAHRDYYTNARYQEAEARSDFINKFFIALGWDVNHERQRNPYQREVRIERGVSTQEQGRSTASRRADYAFYVAPDFDNERLFVEAKKPSVALQSPDIYHQAIKYAYSSSHPLVVLFNFDELHILDSRARPSAGDLFARCLARFSFADYSNEEKFSEIYYLLARDEVAKGSLDRYVKSVIAKSGKPLKLIKNPIAVDAAFLADLDRFREVLAKAFKKTRPELDGYELTEITQRTLDRLVFIRFLEDKFILPDTIIEKVATKGSDAWQEFIKHCKRLNDRFNGQIFNPHPVLDGPDFADDGETFASICAELSSQTSDYAFAYIPIPILGSIYERFLGKVIRATPKQAKVEEKDEVRKAGGVYYTPDYIVRYIIKHTVGELIAGKTPNEIAQLHFADIACGSGSFLLGVFDAVLQYHKHWFNEHPAEAKKNHCYQKEKGGEWFLPLHLKKQILLNNVFGVDIDQQAVEVAQLSLYLKLLDEESMGTTQQFSLDYDEKILPDLAGNIVCGNSLIGRDILEGQLFDNEALRKLNPMDFGHAFRGVMRAGGFDAIIGNPPYVRQEILGDTFKDYAKIHFKTYTATADLCTYFIERAHSQLKEGGRFGYIVSNKFMRANYGKNLRDFLASQTQIRLLVDFGDLPVFAGAVTYPLIIVTKNTIPKKQRFIHAAIQRLDFDSLDEEVAGIGQMLDETAIEEDGWMLANKSLLEIFNKIKTAGIPLGEYVEGKIYRGVLTGLNEAFVIDAVTRRRLIREDRKSAELIKPFLIGKDIKRYATLDSQRFLIFTRHGVNIDSYPAIQAHLEQYKKYLMPKPQHWKGKTWGGRKPGSYKWYEIQDTVDYYKDFEQPKIIYQAFQIQPCFIWDESRVYANNALWIIPGNHKFLLAILNSRMGWFLISHYCTQIQNGYQLIYKYLANIPIPNPPDKARHDKIVALVDRMLRAKQALAQSRSESDIHRFTRECEALDRDIDAQVYQLYGLSTEEIALIEGDNNGARDTAAREGATLPPF